MAHVEQRIFFQELNRRFQERFKAAEHILEVGSLNINGTVRDFFPANVTYLGIDIGPGDGVDLVVPGELLELPDSWADITISTECFEHAINWKSILENMIRLTKADGLVILTFAGFERTTHGTLDSDLGSSPFTPSYYQNLIPDDIYQAIQIGELFSSHAFEVNSKSHDTYFWGIRNSNPFISGLESLRTLEVKLARARGQLGQAVQKNSELSQELSRLQQVLDERNHRLESLQQEIIAFQSIRDGHDQNATLSQELARLQQALDERDHRLEVFQQEIISLQSIRDNHKNESDQLHAGIKKTEEDLNTITARLEIAYQEWDKLQVQLQEAHEQWQRSQAIIQAMESSKFWKAKRLFSKIRKKISF